MAPHSSTLAWKIPWTEEPGRLQSMGSLGVAEGRTRLSDFTFTFHFHALEKEMATHSSVLTWRIPGTGEPDGLPSMGSHRVGHDWSDLAAASIQFNGIKHIHIVVKPLLSPPHNPTPETTILLSVSVDLTIPGPSSKWNHTVFALFPLGIIHPSHMCQNLLPLKAE